MSLSIIFCLVYATSNFCVGLSGLFYVRFLLYRRKQKNFFLWLSSKDFPQMESAAVAAENSPDRKPLESLTRQK